MRAKGARKPRHRHAGTLGETPRKAPVAFGTAKTQMAECVTCTLDHFFVINTSPLRLAREKMGGMSRGVCHDTPPLPRPTLENFLCEGGNQKAPCLLGIFRVSAEETRKGGSGLLPFGIVGWWRLKDSEARPTRAERRNRPPKAPYVIPCFGCDEVLNM